MTKRTKVKKIARKLAYQAGRELDLYVDLKYVTSCIEEAIHNSIKEDSDE